MRLAAGAAFAVLAAVGVALGTWVIVTSYSPVPYADFWGQLPWLERAYGGDLRLADFWVQANEHRIFVPRLQFLAEYRLFGGTYAFLFTAIAVSSLALAAAFAVAVRLETGDRLLAWGTFCVSAIATMSPVGRENLWWAYQVQFVQVFLFATLAILAVVAAARSATRRWLWVGASALAAVAASYSMANGLLVWLPLLALASCSGSAVVPPRRWGSSGSRPMPPTSGTSGSAPTGTCPTRSVWRRTPASTSEACSATSNRRSPPASSAGSASRSLGCSACWPGEDAPPGPSQSRSARASRCSSS